MQPFQISTKLANYCDLGEKLCDPSPLPSAEANKAPRLRRGLIFTSVIYKASRILTRTDVNPSLGSKLSFCLRSPLTPAQPAPCFTDPSLISLDGSILRFINYSYARAARPPELMASRGSAEQALGSASAVSLTWKISSSIAKDTSCKNNGKRGKTKAELGEPKSWRSPPQPALLTHKWVPCKRRMEMLVVVFPLAPSEP